MTTILSKRSKASHVSSILKSSSLQSRVQNSQRTSKVRFELPYSRKVRKILESFVEEKQAQEFENLVVLIRDAEILDDDLRTLLDEANQCISILNYDLRLFVEALLSVNWNTRSKSTVALYQSFVLNLVSAHNYHAKFAINKLVSNFIPENEETHWIDGTPNEKDCEKFKNVHCILNKLLDVVPMCKNLIISSLASQFPYLKKSAHVHEVYVHNILCIFDTQPTLRSEILRLLFSKLVILDVNAPREEITKAEEAEPVDEEVFRMEIEEESLKNQVKHPVAHSLDLCLDKIYNYIIMECHNLDTGELIWDKTKVLYQDMLSVFDQVILPTYNTHHVQFSMFTLCSLKSSLTEGFLNYLWKKICNPNEASILRQAAAAYLSSLIARGSFVPITMLKGSLQQMADWIHAYIASQDGNEFINCDIRVHGVFYSVCQGLFYVVAFRQKELVSTRKNITFLESLNLGKIVTCKLNPLRVCQSAVVQNFAAVTRTYQLAYCYSVIEHNARNQLPIIYQDEKGNYVTCNNTLDAFFPFDPYVLKRSGEKIWPFYLNYQEPDQSKKGKKRKKKHSKRTETEDDDFLCMEAENTTNDDRFSYGTSPGFKHKQ